MPPTTFRRYAISTIQFGTALSVLIFFSTATLHRLSLAQGPEKEDWEIFGNANVLDGDNACRYSLLVYQAYLANREKFRFYTCYCRMRGSSKVSSIDSALQGDIPYDEDCCGGSASDMHSEADIFIARFQDRFLHRVRKVPPLKTPPGPRGIMTMICFEEVDTLWNLQYYVQRRLKNSQMGETSIGSRWWYSCCLGPWERGTSARDLTPGLEDLRTVGAMKDFDDEWAKRIQVRVRRNVPLTGRSTTLIEVVGLTTPRSSLHRWWIDEERGYIPVRWETIFDCSFDAPDDQPVDDAWAGSVIDIRKIGDGWWPYHWVAAHTSGESLTLGNVWTANNAGVKVAIEGKVTKLQLRKPSTRLFAVTLEKDDQLGTHDDKKREPLVMEKRTRVTLEDIPRLLARYYGKPEPPPPPAPSWGLGAVAVAVGVLAVTVLAVVLVHRYRRRASA